MYDLSELTQKLQFLAEKYQLSRIILFGSYARGEADAQSDIDLVLDMEGSPILGWEFFEMEEDFQKTLQKPVDILTLDEVKESISYLMREVRQHIVEEGIVLYEKESASKRLFLF